MDCYIRKCPRKDSRIGLLLAAIDWDDQGKCAARRAKPRRYGIANPPAVKRPRQIGGSYEDVHAHRTLLTYWL